MFIFSTQYSRLHAHHFINMDQDEMDEWCACSREYCVEKMNIKASLVELGEVEIDEQLSREKHEQLKNSLLAFGLELMDDKKGILIEKIKNIIVEMIHYSEELPVINFSHFLSEKLNYEHYIIAHKIERAKELMIYNELTLTEIAYKLHYSSVAHLSNQFKKVTGLTPSFFKKMKHKRLIALEDL